ncbi:toprim domain protein, partial [Vibrio parahaemolyticus V-223/04]
LRKKRHSVC